MPVRQPRSPAHALADAHALGMDLWQLGWESAAVIGLRTFKLALGDSAAQSEAQRMVAEKITAAAQLPFVAASAGLSPEQVMRKTVRHYARKVRANRRRLSSGKSR